MKKILMLICVLNFTTVLSKQSCYNIDSLIVVNQEQQTWNN